MRQMGRWWADQTWFALCAALQQSIILVRCWNDDNMALCLVVPHSYQPHIIAPENGYRRLIEDGLQLLRDPAFMAVEQVGDLLGLIDLPNACCCMTG
jgi:hypothetical protein